MEGPGRLYLPCYLWWPYFAGLGDEMGWWVRRSGHDMVAGVDTKA